LPWAKQVEVDGIRKQVTLRADPARYDEKALVRALDDAGFAGSRLVK
jgi:hypothetical protein